MLSEICIALLTIAALLLVIFIIRFLLQMRESVQSLQTDLHDLTLEVKNCLSGMDEFIRSDLHHVSLETTDLIQKLGDLSADINDKSHSLNFLFKPLGFLSSVKTGAVPQLLKWVLSSAFLMKTTKELVKKYGK